jgi:hypothetical protein
MEAKTYSKNEIINIEDETENMDANLVVSADASLSGSNFFISNTSNDSYLTSSYDMINSVGEDRFNENYDATIIDKSNDYDYYKSKGIGEGKNNKKSRKNKISKRTIFLSATLDIALAGLLIGWIYKKPTITKIQIGVGSIGLLSFYGAQWISYKKYKND